MTKSIFITATGTDAGKTYVSGLLVKKMRSLGLNCGYFKPALSGAEMIDGKLIPGDCLHVIKTANIDKDPSDCVSYVYEPAVSPHLASEMENRYIKFDKIKKDFEKIKSEYDYIVTEGCGGIVCPINLHDEKLMLTDIIKGLGLDIIITAPAVLGTINYTVLTADYAKKLGINIKGIILNNYDKTDMMHRDNLKRIEELTGIKIIAVTEKNASEIEIDTETLLSVFKEV